MRPLPRRALLRGLGVPVLLGLLISASAPGWTTIRISRGDTLSELAVRHHTTVAQLIALNSLPGNGDLIYAGSELRVPLAAPVRSTVRDGTYVVRPGDTLIAIARRFHTTPAWMARRNQLPASRMVRIGQRLVVPVPAAATTSQPPAASTATSRAARDRALLAARPAVSRGTVRALVASAARDYGVDPNLALAVCYQESGFQQGVISGSGAVGAMQVLPSTGQYVSDYVVHRRLDIFDPRDNVVAGVAFLATLLRTVPTEQAVAGYYQGPGSLRARGVLPATKAYVANVLQLRQEFAGG